MAAPFPPQGNQQQRTERPVKVYAEQYLSGAPLPIGTNTDIAPPIYPNGEPRIYAGGNVYRLHDTDWVLSNRYTGEPIEVVGAEEFAERFGPAELAI